MQTEGDLFGINRFVFKGLQFHKGQVSTFMTSLFIVIFLSLFY